MPNSLRNYAGSIMRKKAAFLFYVLRDSGFQSGGEKVNFYIIKAISELGYDVDVYCVHNYVDNSEYIKNIYVSESSDEFNARKNEYDFTLTHGNSTKADFMYLHENTRYYRNNIVRSPFEQFVKRIFKHKRFIQQKKQIQAEKESFDNAKKILIPSSFVKDDLNTSYNIDDDKIFIIPPFTDMNVENYIKKEHDTFTFGLSARGFDNKGGYEFLYSAIILKMLGFKFKAKIIYPFSSSSKRMKKILNFLGLKDTIEILDYCENMDDFYSEIDCLVMASKREAFGLVAVEAIARKIPVIINTRCGVKDFIIHNENGFIYDYKRPILNLIKIMKYVLINRDKLPLITENALKILDKLTFDAFKNKFSELINEFENK